MGTHCWTNKFSSSNRSAWWATWFDSDRLRARPFFQLIGLAIFRCNVPIKHFLNVMCLRFHAMTRLRFKLTHFQLTISFLVGETCSENYTIWSLSSSPQTKNYNLTSLGTHNFMKYAFTFNSIHRGGGEKALRLNSISYANSIETQTNKQKRRAAELRWVILSKKNFYKARESNMNDGFFFFSSTAWLTFSVVFFVEEEVFKNLF